MALEPRMGEAMVGSQPLRMCTRISATHFYFFLSGEVVVARCHGAARCHGSVVPGFFIFNLYAPCFLRLWWQLTNCMGDT